MFGLGWNATTATWVIAALATAGVIVRPFAWPEAIWAVLGAAALLVLHLIGHLLSLLTGKDIIPLPTSHIDSEAETFE